MIKYIASLNGLERACDKAGLSRGKVLFIHGLTRKDFIVQTSLGKRYILDTVKRTLRETKPRTKIKVIKYEN
jgi:hypothetical protein